MLELNSFQTTAACRRKRNHIDYDGSQIVSRTETEELISKASEYREIVERWIANEYPDHSLGT